MARTSDKNLLRGILNRDRAAFVYPLGDLDDRQFPLCTWYVAPDLTAFLLLYSGGGTPVLAAGGDPIAVGWLVDEAGRPSPAHIHVPPDVVPELVRRYRSVSTRALVRMDLRTPRLPDTTSALSLDLTHVHALEQLYRDGTAAGEEPDFFFPSMLEDGTFFGIWEDGSLVAAAGTHLVSPGESVAAIGNVYTRRDRRGCGLGSITTAAVVKCLLDRGIRTVALSVIEENTRAIRVYERLGFTVHCSFVDGAVVF